MIDKRRQAILMTIASALLWGSSFSVVKIGLRYLDPYSFVFLRFSAATAILLGLVLLRGEWHLFRAYLGDRYTVLLGLTLAASYACQFAGQALTTASKAVIIINSSVVLVAPLSYLLLKEAIGVRKLVALALGIVGVYLVTVTPRGAPAETGRLAGSLLVSGSAVAYGLYVVITRMAVTRRTFSTGALMAAVFLWSLPIFAVLSAPAFARGVHVPGPAWVVIAYLAVFCSILPFVLWTAAMKYIRALTSAIVLLAELIFGVVIAGIWLRETLSPQVILGCCVISAAIFIVGARK
jgi:drug/metabolite transporter (DMT)-like permease